MLTFRFKLIKTRILIVIAFFFILAVPRVSAQNLPVGFANMEDYYRRNQLLGLVDSSISFNIRPLSLSQLKLRDQERTTIFSPLPDSTQTQLHLLPINWRNKYNTHHPYGWNDGIMIPSKGYQTVLSAGVYFKSGIFSIQLRPELVFAQNLSFDEYPGNYNGNDMPQRFGNKSYQKVSWGQSRVGINFANLSLALSNENIWWGPGIQSAIIMTNTAPGFKHLTFNTTKPISTYIGSFEGQIIAGRLENSGYIYSDLNKWRYFTGVSVSYQPKWIPGVFLGLNRTFQSYSDDLKKFSDYIPLFRPYQKVKDNNQNQFGSDNKDQLTSLYLRWLLKKTHAELYFEYGLNDNSYNLRDFFLSPQHSRAYLFGLRKLFYTNAAQNEYIQVGLETTQLSQSLDRILRPAGAWYNHSEIFEGHTNEGQVLGSGTGPGGNLQTLNAGWYGGFKHLGLQFERYEHQADFYEATFENPLKNGRWIDLSGAAVADWTYQNFMVNAKLQGIHSINYQWKSGFNNLPKQNVFNLNVELGITYFFNKN